MTVHSFIRNCLQLSLALINLSLVCWLSVKTQSVICSFGLWQSERANFHLSLCLSLSLSVFVVDDVDDCGIVDVDDDGNYDGDFSSHRSVTEQRGALPTSDTKWRHSVSQTFHLLW